MSEALRDEIRAWLDEHWDPTLLVEDWWRVVARAGWTAPHLPPEQGGRGLPRWAGAVVRAEFARYGALRPPGGLGLLMAAPTILAHGTSDQIARHVPPILEGRVNWCQLFSEPGSGSDLAGLTTRAERDGDRYVVTGQKVWSSMAHESDWGMLLARTDFGVPKHAGISWFAIALDQPGVTIRPLREMTGASVFNEVFLDEVVCDAADLVGGAGNGWAVAQTTLFFERSGIGAGGGHAGFPVPGPKGGMLGRRAGDAARDPEPGGNLVLRYPDVADLARARGRTGDPIVRQSLARLYTWSRLGHWNAQRARAEGSNANPAVPNLAKLAQTRIVKHAATLAAEILGPAVGLAGDDAPEGGRYTDALVFSPASSIYGGTDEIQRNVVAERALGLPRDDQPGRGEPYGEVLARMRRD